MAYKFPWTNYHELNLDWILNTVKELFAKTEQNNAIVEQYDGRLTEVELTADNAQTAAEQAQQNSTAALDLAQGAQTTATQAQQAAGQAQQAAGQAQQAAGQAQEAAATAQQTATQAQQTAQNFDGRITQAENNAANALQAAQAFDEQVQGAITAANNANEAATLALTTATETSRELAAQRSTLDGIVSDGVTSLQDAAQDATEEIEAAGQTVLDSIPADYTTLTNKKADVIYNTAAGEIASFNDGADDMKIKSLIVNIESAQAGSGDPSPDNIRPISGHTGAEIKHTGKNLFKNNFTDTYTYGGVIFTRNSDGSISVNGTATQQFDFYITSTASPNLSNLLYLPDGNYLFNGITGGSSVTYRLYLSIRNSLGAVRYVGINEGSGAITLTKESVQMFLRVYSGAAVSITIYPMVRLASEHDDSYEPYLENQISITFPIDAGTVYGGILTINHDRTGKLVVDKKGIVYDGSEDEAWNLVPRNSRAYITVQGIITTVSDISIVDIKSNQYKAYRYISDTAITRITGRYGIEQINIFDFQRIADGTTVNDWRTLLRDKPVQVIYPLATPITYTLTESEISGILSTVYGVNNIWSDVGSINVEYPADTKTYIDNKVAELQALILEH